MEESNENSKEDEEEEIDSLLMDMKARDKKIRDEIEAMLARDNLKIKMMAKYKSIKTGAMQDFLDIENEVTDLAFNKGKAYSDSSMEEMERAIESEFEDRGVNNVENNFGRNSQNSELHASIDSKDDYWQNIQRD